ncbi:MAG: hypothetical protein LBH49_00515 [Puniceicoccales bacterium]|jgi:hypothetical protein|nr:hypothetical protein [Puniceicoccales bacterium]
MKSFLKKEPETEKGVDAGLGLILGEEDHQLGLDLGIILGRVLGVIEVIPGGLWPKRKRIISQITCHINQ